MNDIENNSIEAKFLEALRGYAIYSPNTQMLRGILQDPQKRNPIGLSGGGLAEGFEKLVYEARHDEELEYAISELKALFPWVREIQTEKNVSAILSNAITRPQSVITFVDRFMKKNSNKVTASDASEGILYALFLLTLCLSKSSPTLFSIDNIDLALNPRIITQLMIHLHTWFTELVPEKQILCTAHNPAILDGFNFAEDAVRLFMVDRGENGLTIINRIIITEELISRSKEYNIPLSQLWTEGYLGGMPNV